MKKGQERASLAEGLTHPHRLEGQYINALSQPRYIVLTLSEQPGRSVVAGILHRDVIHACRVGSAMACCDERVPA